MGVIAGHLVRNAAVTHTATKLDLKRDFSFAFNNRERGMK